ncbi:MULTISPECIES: hypothetical protein [Sorangium]|uniref:Peptidase M43 pregnancy-associated plasma-A domain-containing protein n=1 Tax=Sorangium cellulosum TaxID=56 RepID=A0A4P2QT60_SORCE|nr:MULTISPECIES: hypothetical protein [Sorangium]AUX33256.1 hypothetical protein SOCE836_054110 [Sorangium cellulosum]WCQ92571.1 hypothetical protein NQZ70_05314 [Sorangium sp. Soce836]
MTESPASASSATGPSPGTQDGERGATRARRGGLLAAGALAALAAGACGGNVVVDGFEPTDGTGGSGATTSSATPGSSGVGQGGNIGEGGAPPIPPLVKNEFPDVTAGKSIPVHVPPGTLGITAVAQLVTSTPSWDPVGIETITGPDGRTLVTNYSIPGTLAHFFNHGIGTAAVPQTGTAASVPLVPGTYWITVGGGDTGMLAGPARLSVWRRQTLDGRFHGGKIDVNAFIAGNAVSEEYMQRALRSAYRGFVGLDLGDVTVHHLGSEWAVIDEELLPSVLEQTAGAAGRPALNVIAVADFTGRLAGAAGATPSAPSVAVEHGTHLSGIVVALFGDLEADAVILRHELGHFAGLFHTTEMEAGYADPLDDTAECEDMSLSYERCPDYNNVMFPTGGDFSSTMTPQQARIVQASAFYRGVVEDGGGAAPPLPADPGASASEAPVAPPAPGGSARAGAPDRRAWAAALPPRAATLLEGHFCGHSAARGTGFFGWLRAAGGADAERLLAVGRDPGAPAHARARALAAAGRAAAASAPAARVAAELQALAEDPRLPRRARLGAIQGVASASPDAARALAARMAADPDHVVERMAARAAR